MLITEYRIPLPLTVEEYRIGQLFTNVEISKKETGGGEGVEILCNEAISEANTSNTGIRKGQYTYRVYHMAEKIPSFIKNLTPQGLLQIHEESWNDYPYSKTVKKLNIMDDGFSINIQSHHASDRGEQENIHGLSYDLLKKRNVVYIDVVNDLLMNTEPEYDPTKFRSVKTGRGPFTSNWIETVQPVMTCYKLVTVEFKWFEWQTRVEKLIQSTERRLFFLFHRMLLCSLDKWYGLSLKEIQEIETQGAIDLHKMRFEGKVKGFVIQE